MKKDFFNSLLPLFSVSYLVEMGLLVRDLDSRGRENEWGAEGGEKNPSEKKAEVLEVSET